MRALTNRRGVALLVSLALGAGCAADGAEDGAPPPGTTSYNVEGVTRWTAAPCGASLGEFDGTVARSNGGDTGTGVGCAGHGAYGLQYQCVELVMRHFRTHWGLSWSGNAADLLRNAPRDSVSVYSNGDAAHPPAPGDMIVWTDTTWGHVALVTAVSSSAVSILEQNVYGAGGTATLPYSGGRVHGPAGWHWADPAGWAHAHANHAGGGSGTGAEICTQHHDCASCAGEPHNCGWCGASGACVQTTDTTGRSVCSGEWAWTAAACR